MPATDADHNENEDTKVNVEEEMSAVKSAIVDNWKKIAVSVVFELVHKMRSAEATSWSISTAVVSSCLPAADIPG